MRVNLAIRVANSPREEGKLVQVGKFCPFWKRVGSDGGWKEGGWFSRAKEELPLHED